MIKDVAKRDHNKFKVVTARYYIAALWPCGWKRLLFDIKMDKHIPDPLL